MSNEFSAMVRHHCPTGVPEPSMLQDRQAQAIKITRIILLRSRMTQERLLRKILKNTLSFQVKYSEFPIYDINPFPVEY